MIQAILSDDVQQFILAHENDDPAKLLLKFSHVGDVPMAVVVQQIIGRQKARRKLPLFYNTPGVVYPPGRNLEQSSSQQTGIFKRDYLASLLPATAHVADLTAGFGIDSFFLSQAFSIVDCVEPVGSLLEIARHNHSLLDANTVRYFTTDAAGYLATATKLDVIYIDPDRRTSTGQKVVTLRGCQPDVTAMLDAIFKVTPCLLLKASPLLDIQLAIGELRFVKHVHAVSVDGECRELLFTCVRDFQGDPVLEAVNIRKDVIDSMLFYRHEETEASPNFSPPQTYLYQPNASMLKTGAFKLGALRYQLSKLHRNTHMYTSDKLVEDFPGETFRVIASIKPTPAAFRLYFPEGKAHVFTRNYPLTSDALKKRCRLREGGNWFLIGVTGPSEKHLLVAEKIKG